MPERAFRIYSLSGFDMLGYPAFSFEEDVGRGSF